MQTDSVAVVTKTCPKCGKPGEITVTKEGLERYWNGWSVQDAFPTLRPALREQILTGYHPECWELTFAYLDEEHEGE